MYSIYRIFNTSTGKSYIGMTKRTVDKRFKSHLYEARKCKYNMYLHNSIRVHGEERFQIETIETDLTHEQAVEKERYYIKTLNTIQPHGYNEHAGGRGGCSEASPELRKKLSEARKGKVPWNKGHRGKQKGWNTGQHGLQDYSNPEHRKKRSESAKKRWARVRAEKQVDSVAKLNLQSSALLLTQQEQHSR